MAHARDIDVVLLGPTGVTGREVARHLQARSDALGLRWAVAGRNLDRMRASLAAVGAEPAEMLVVDVDDAAAVADMVGRSKVIANLAGPYARHGSQVHAACAASGTHQVDLSGEIDWIASMIAAHDDAATDSGAIIVPACGFESLPFDLGALLAAHELHERTGDPVVSVDVAVETHQSAQVRSIADVVSGGTLASGLDQMLRGDRDAITDPHVLDLREGAASPASRYDLRPRRHALTGHWLAPMVPTPYLNPPIVHRSASLLRASADPIFAPSFAYREGTDATGAVGSALGGTAAVALAGVAAGLGAATRLPAGVRSGLVSFLSSRAPQPGEGPREEDLDDWAYTLSVRAVDARGAVQDVVVHGEGHPGYRSTARMVGEAALALADPTAGLPDGAGYLTPATALGLAMLDRLGAAGLTFTIA